MTVTISSQMRVVLALAGLAALGLAAFMLGIGRPSGAGQASVAPIKRLHPVRKTVAHAPKKVTPKKVAPKKVTPKKVTPKKPAPRPVALLPGLTPEIAAALRTHDLVVVSLFDPQARVDQISLAEASAGAKAAGAGFVPLDVLRQRQAGPLLEQLGVLPDPAVLVYRRPGDIVARFDGFADRDTVAQAVVNAAPPGLAAQAEVRAQAAPAPVTLRAWGSRASKICGRVLGPVRPISATASKAEFLRWAPTMLAAEQQILAGLKALPAPTEAADRLLAQRLVAAIASFHAVEVRVVDLVRREGKAGGRRLLPADQAAVARANSAANAAGATGCAVFE